MQNKLPPYWRNSDLSYVKKGHKHLLHHVNNKKTFGKDKWFTIGSAFHTLVLEPDEFDKRYVIAKDFGEGQMTQFCEKLAKIAANCEFCGLSGTFNPEPYFEKVYKEVGFKRDSLDTVIKKFKGEEYHKYEWFISAAKLDSLTQEDVDNLQRMRDSAYQCQRLMELMDGDGYSPVMIEWNLIHNLGFEIDTSSTLDIFNKRMNFIGDLKTSSTSIDKWADHSFNEYGYYRQAAVYMDMIEIELGIKPDGFRFIVVEKTEPYSVGVFDASPKAIERGRKEYRELAEKMISYLKKDKIEEYYKIID